MSVGTGMFQYQYPKITGYMRITILCVALLLTLASTSDAQWSWAKAVGVSGSTEWDAVTVDETGNFIFCPARTPWII